MNDREILLFDVNETLLDLSALRPHFATHFGDERLMGEWFGLLLRLSLVATITHTYRPFDALGVAALQSTAQKYQRPLSNADAVAILQTMHQLPPHPDVIPALTQLQAAGYRLATLTNSSPPLLQAQLDFARLTPFFEKQLSVEAVQLFKPAPETYRYAAAQFGVPASQVRLIAAHEWDVTGAIRAGARAAFVARPGMVLSEAAEIPDIIGANLLEIAATL
jgi:2-haloacid dehalogenase